MTFFKYLGLEEGIKYFKDKRRKSKWSRESLVLSRWQRPVQKNEANAKGPKDFIPPTDL